MMTIKQASAFSIPFHDKNIMEEIEKNIPSYNIPRVRQKEMYSTYTVTSYNLPKTTKFKNHSIMNKPRNAILMVLVAEGVADLDLYYLEYLPFSSLAS